MGYQREREDFIAAMVAEGMRADSARLIMRHATTVQRLATEACNRELTDAEKRRETRATARIVEILQAHSEGGAWAVSVAGDPRGYCVRIMVPSGRGNNLGGGMGVPTRRF